MSIDGTVLPTIVTPKKGNMIKIDTPIDFSFMKLSSPAELLTEKARGMKERGPEEKYSVKSVKLNNNHFQTLPDLFEVLSQVILRPEDITWIDLSFNELTNIDRVFTKFPKLQILYLQGNRIDDISEVDKLAEITTLRKIALHGNPIENIKHYRSYIIQRCPHLINVDMSQVTKADRTTASFKVKPPTPSKKKHAND